MKSTVTVSSACDLALSSTMEVSYGSTAFSTPTLQDLPPQGPEERKGALVSDNHRNRGRAANGCGAQSSAQNGIDMTKKNVHKVTARKLQARLGGKYCSHYQRVSDATEQKESICRIVDHYRKNPPVGIALTNDEALAEILAEEKAEATREVLEQEARDEILADEMAQEQSQSEEGYLST
jgi:hypothetical protein